MKFDMMITNNMDQRIGYFLSNKYKMNFLTNSDLFLSVADNINKIINYDWITINVSTYESDKFKYHKNTLTIGIINMLIE